MSIWQHGGTVLLCLPKTTSGQTFYSLGAMWDMRKENFLQSVSWLNSLQLKVSYGTTGNSGISAYNALALVGSGLLYNGQPGIAPSTVGNDNRHGKA